MSKATLSVEIDSSLIERVHRYSREHGKGVSETVSELIENLPVERTPRNVGPAASGQADEEGWEAELTPGVRALLGVAAGPADEEDYHRYLLEKYGQ